MTPPNPHELLDAPYVVVDTETTGTDWVRGDKIFGVSLAWTARGEINTWYVDIRVDPNALDFLRDTLPRCQRTVGHYYKFDVHMLRGAGIILPLDKIECTMIRECVLDEDKYVYSLERIAQDRLGVGKEQIWEELAQVFGGDPTKDAQIGNLARAPMAVVARYARVDAERTLQVYESQQKDITEQGLERIALLERKLLGVVIKMEASGVRVDRDRAERSIPLLDAECATLQEQVDHIAGRRGFNVNSPPQVKALLGVHQASDGQWRTSDGMLLEPTESGKSGSLKTEQLYRSAHPAAAKIATIRGLIKARDVFLRKYVLEMSHHGRIHANINQTRSEEGDGTYTGRFSITEPALQQIHKRNKRLAAIVRACFVPDTGAEWGCYDWRQKDFRIFAHYINDQRINGIYAADPLADFHRTVSEITGLPRDRDERTGGANAKQMNLGLVFGMSAGRMAKEMRLPFTTETSRGKAYLKPGPEAEELFNKYHANIPGVEELRKSASSVAKTRGYILTQLGRRLRFTPDKAYKAAGILFQGQAAESMKVKMVELDDLLGGRDDVKLQLVVHDEFDFSMRVGRHKTVDEDIQRCLETFDGSGEFPLKYRIPIRSDYGVGQDWYEASSG